jgi:ribulose 1,5-bisphosphate carboxylase large subunit-like protein
MSSYNRQQYERRKLARLTNPELRNAYNIKRRKQKMDRTERYLAEIGFDSNKIDTGVCCFTECNTIRSKYNKDLCCAAHQRTIALYGFYRIIEKENYDRAPARDI